MAAYCRVYGFGHLRADCQEDWDQLWNPTLISSMELHRARLRLIPNSL